jgi:cytochrome b561
MTEAAAPAAKYSPLAKLLHWSIALLIFVQLGIGWTMPEVHKETRPVGEIAWHLKVGTLIVLLVALRVLWRLASPPRRTDDGRGWLARVAQAIHALLYLLLVAVPLLGWANAGSRDWAVGLGSWLDLPRIMPVGSKLGHAFGDVHGNLAVVLAVLVGIHIVAGLYHHFVLRDGILRRMW